MLPAKPQLFGKAAMQEDRITDFEHRSFWDAWVNAGHYVFSKDTVTEYCPQEGDLENDAENNHLKD